MGLKRQKISVKDLMDAGFLHAGQKLYFGQIGGVQAQVTPAGKVSLGGVEYRSLSGAASSINNTSLNGWRLWHVQYEGTWIYIDELRKRFEA